MIMKIKLNTEMFKFICFQSEAKQIKNGRKFRDPFFNSLETFRFADFLASFVNEGVFKN